MNPPTPAHLLTPYLAARTLLRWTGADTSRCTIEPTPVSDRYLIAKQWDKKGSAGLKHDAFYLPAKSRVSAIQQLLELDVVQAEIQDPALTFKAQQELADLPHNKGVTTITVPSNPCQYALSTNLLWKESDRLAKEKHDSVLAWVVGLDVYMYMHVWETPPRLPEHGHLVVVGRPENYDDFLAALNSAAYLGAVACENPLQQLQNAVVAVDFPGAQKLIEVLQSRLGLAVRTGNTTAGIVVLGRDGGTAGSWAWFVAAVSGDEHAWWTSLSSSAVRAGKVPRTPKTAAYLDLVAQWQPSSDAATAQLKHDEETLFASLQGSEWVRDGKLWQPGGGDAPSLFQQAPLQVPSE